MPVRLGDLFAIAHRQDGIVTRAQLHQLGASKDWIRRRRLDGTLHHVRGAAFAVGGPPTSTRGLLRSAVLGAAPQAVVSHGSAAVLHHLDGAIRGRPTVSVPHPANVQIDGVRVRQPTDLAGHHVTTVDDLRVTTVARTLVDLGYGRDRLGRMYDDARASGALARGEVETLVTELRRRGKRGLDHVLAMLEEREDGQPPPQSWLERRFLELIAPLALPNPLRQHPMRELARRHGWVDFWWPHARVVVEVDGRRWHQRREDMVRDRGRDAELLARGIVTLRLMHEQLSDAAGTRRLVVDVLSASARRIA